MSVPPTEEELRDLYAWVDSIPLSKPKRNISRDFSDGVLVAEMVKHHFPKLVDLKNYTTCNNAQQKHKNWEFLNRKVLQPLKFEINDSDMTGIIKCQAGVIEHVLIGLRRRIDQILYHQSKYPPHRHFESDKPEADQSYDPYAFKKIKIPRVEPYDPFNDYKGKKGSNRRSPVKGNHFELITHQNLGRSDPMASPHMQQMTTTGQPKAVVPYFSGGPDSQAVSALMYEEKVQECYAKDETINILNAKISKLEHILYLKDLQIDDLHSQYESMKPAAAAQKKKQPKPRFR